MKKNGFIQGAFVATLGIVLTKILGIIYVVPFYAIIGAKGGALYGYAYNIYSIFLGISQAGIPLAVSKITSEYQTLGYYEAKERTYKLAKRLLFIIGVTLFLILFIFAPTIADMIIGDIQGGNTKEDIAFVIRMISTAILVVPIMSTTRGYFQGHKFITPTSISQVLEQIVRVLIIIVGSYIGMKFFGLKAAVGIAVFAATIGALSSYFYLIYKKNKNKKEFIQEKTAIKQPKITNAQIIKKILVYSIPLIMIDVFRSLYNSVDTVTLVKTLVNGLGYTAEMAESIMSVISTWGNKLNMIVIAITTGFMTSLIPNLTRSLVSKDYNDVKKKVNQTLQILLFLSVPMVFGLSFLAGPVWTVFYGAKAASSYGTVAFQYYVFVALAMTLFTSSITIVQVLKGYKAVLISLISGFIVKVALNVSLIRSFSEMGIGLPAYYGAITATILGLLVSTFISLTYINKKFKVQYEDTLNKTLNILISAIIMVVVLSLLKFIVPFTSTSRLVNILIIMLYAIVGALVYLFINLKNNMVASIFGKEYIEKFTKKLNRKQKSNPKKKRKG